MSKPNSVEEKPQVRLRPIRQKNRGPGCPRRLFGDFFGVEKVTRPGGRNSPSPGRGGGQPPQDLNCLPPQTAKNPAKEERSDNEAIEEKRGGYHHYDRRDPPLLPVRAVQAPPGGGPRGRGGPERVPLHRRLCPLSGGPGRCAVLFPGGDHQPLQRQLGQHGGEHPVGGDGGHRHRRYGGRGLRLGGLPGIGVQ